MAEADNGKVTSAVLGEKLDNLAAEFHEFKTEMRGVVSELVKSNTTHVQQAKEHCYQLYSPEGQSRIQALEARVKPLEDRASVGGERRWNLATILISAAVGVGSSVTTAVIVARILGG